MHTHKENMQDLERRRNLLLFDFDTQVFLLLLLLTIYYFYLHYIAPIVYTTTHVYRKNVFLLSQSVGSFHFFFRERQKRETSLEEK